MPIVISRKVLEKLSNKHDVSQREVEQCFENTSGLFLQDTREKHQSDPATLWFIAPTNKDRLLKVCFIPRGKNLVVRTAYEPNKEELDIFLKKLRKYRG